MIIEDFVLCDFEFGETFCSVDSLHIVRTLTDDSQLLYCILLYAFPAVAMYQLGGLRACASSCRHARIECVVGLRGQLMCRSFGLWVSSNGRYRVSH